MPLKITIWGRTPVLETFLSSDGETIYHVEYDEFEFDRMVCDCPSFEFRKCCRHVQLVECREFFKNLNVEELFNAAQRR